MCWPLHQAPSRSRLTNKAGFSSPPGYRRQLDLMERSYSWGTSIGSSYGIPQSSREWHVPVPPSSKNSPTKFSGDPCPYLFERLRLP